MRPGGASEDGPLKSVRVPAAGAGIGCSVQDLRQEVKAVFYRALPPGVERVGVDLANLVSHKVVVARVDDGRGLW